MSNHGDIYIMELKTLNTRIQQLGKKTAKWRDDVQLVLVACAYHAIEGNNGAGNADPFTQVIKVLEGADMRAVIKWAEMNAGVVWQRSEETFRINKAKRGSIEYDAITLMATPWWQLARKAREIESTLDCLEAVRHLVARLEKEAASGRKELIHAEAIVKLKEVCGSLERADVGA